MGRRVGGRFVKCFALLLPLPYGLKRPVDAILLHHCFTACSFHSNLGYALQLSSQRELAIAEYRKAIELDPKLVSAWVNLATILARDPATRTQARAALMTAKRLDPQDPRVKANLDELDALEKGQILK